MLNKELLIGELQQLRTSIGDYHNHKEQTAYAVFALAVALTSWVQATTTKLNTEQLWLIGFSAVGLHFVIRWQLIKRRHAAQLYRVYSASIRRVLQMSPEEVGNMQVQHTPPKSLTSLSAEYKFRSFLVPLTKESWPDLANSYPVFAVVHQEMESVISRVRYNPIIEILPSLGSLGCLVSIGCKIFVQGIPI